MSIRPDKTMSRRVSLRDVVADDLERFFAFQLDADANDMAAFTSSDPSSRSAFDAHWCRRLSDTMNVNRTIVLDESIVVGSVTRFVMFDKSEITYWIDRSHWGRGIATCALRLFLDEVVPHDRPIFARTAHDNIASIRVLEKCDFLRIGTDRNYANARGEVIEEFIFQLG